MTMQGATTKLSGEAVKALAEHVLSTDAWPMRLNLVTGEWAHNASLEDTYGNVILNTHGEAEHSANAPPWMDELSTPDAIEVARAVMEHFPPEIRWAWLLPNVGRNHPTAEALYWDVGIEHWANR